MCGIAGFVSFQSPSEPVLRRMLDTITHRGPDDSGIYSDGLAAIGMRRLSIIDLASGHQPMANEDESLWIVYNGEIFNHSDVRPELEAAGHVYRTRCDTEAIVHAYEQWGAGCLDHFRGMFAFALWNSRTRRLFAARDRLGKKPFYYYFDGKLFAFASEIKALLAHPAISARLNPEALPECLAFGYTSSDATLFAGIRKLPPGHYLEMDWSGERPELVTRRYWDAPHGVDAPERSDEEWIGDCRARLEETVRMRLMSDVPLGMFLSGGVDSSAIAAIAARMVPGKLKTFAVGYREAAFSELGFARDAARHIGTDHHEVVIGMEEFFNALPRLVWHEDEPLTWPSSVSLYYVSKLAREHVTVVLTGEGSDELFAGYERYRHHLFNTRWLERYRIAPAGLRAGVRRWVAETPLLSADLRRKVQHSFAGREPSLESLYFDNFYCAFSQAQQAELLGRGGGTAYSHVLGYWAVEPQRSLLGRMLYADQKTYLVELLMKQDQMSMAASIESRVPFLDHEFVEFAARVPDGLKLRGGIGKYILKQSISDLLPDSIVHRKKMGFPTPLRQWLRQPEAAPVWSLLRDPDGLLAEVVDRAALERLIAIQQEGVEDATDRLWRLLNLQIWGDVFLTGRRRTLAEPLLETAVQAHA